MWMGLGGMINDFRTDVLKLQPFRFGEGGESVLEDNDVPISHMWSPSFVPRCVDWPLHVDVVGDFTRAQPSDVLKPVYRADPRLTAFIDKCGASAPIFIGFGSMVIADPTRLVEMVKVRTDRPITLSPTQRSVLITCLLLCAASRDR